MSRVSLLALGLALGVSATPAHAATTLFSLAIGYNGIPDQASSSSTAVLRYADDDALAVHEVARMVARRSVVLAIPDRATQERYPAALQARPPSLAELRRVLADLKADIERATRAGEDVDVWLFYSGHGWLDHEGKASLTLADGALSQEMLYDEVLPALSGRTLHLMIDACHAEAMIRSRDVTAHTVEVSRSEMASASLRTRLDNLPSTGLVMASASTTQAHEWDEYQTGVFTHELLSGLRGGADVNGDGRVEYSEMGAFLAAANRGVADARARLTTLVLAPKLYPRVAIIDMRSSRSSAHLQGMAHHLGRFQVDDLHGNRLLDMHTEPGFPIDVLVPGGERILLSNDLGEVEILTAAERPTNIENLSLKEASMRSRSALAQSMQRGLFSAAFGPSYYQGFVDSAPQQLIPVDLSPPGVRAFAVTYPETEHHHSAWTAYALGATSLAASGVLAILAARARSDYYNTDFEQPSMIARDRYAAYGIASLSTLMVGSLCMGFGYWLDHRDGNGSRPLSRK